jgi:ABC-2 type transport system permease protein
MKRHAEVLRTSAWLGWQVETNWTDPTLFLATAIAKPLSITLILFFMARVVSQGQATADTFLFLFLGNTFFLYVTEVLIGISWAVFRDREDFETLKYVYATPASFLTYLVGRSMTKVLTATLGVAVSLLFGRWALGLPIGGPGTDWGLALLGTLLGLVSVIGLGIILAGTSLVLARHSMSMNEGLAGLFFLLSGAVFPIELLPGWAEAIGLALPFTWWLELMRRIFTGRTFAEALAGFSQGDLWGILVLSTAGILVVALLWFRACERTARARGLIDWKTNY